MAYYSKINTGERTWVNGLTLTSPSSGAISTNQAHTSLSQLLSYLQAQVSLYSVNVGTKYYSYNFNINRYYQYEVGLDYISSVYFNGALKRHLYGASGETLFGELPTVSIIDTYYNEISDYVRIRYSVNFVWDIDTWQIKYDINDSTPDLKTSNISARSANGYLYIYNARTTFGTGSKNCYVQIEYKGIKTNVASRYITITVPAPNKWVYLNSFTSSPNFPMYDVAVYAGDSVGWQQALVELEAYAPAANYTKGDLAVAEDDNGDYHEYEVQ